MCAALERGAADAVAGLMSFAAPGGGRHRYNSWRTRAAGNGAEQERRHAPLKLAWTVHWGLLSEHENARTGRSQAVRDDGDPKGTGEQTCE